MKKTFRAKLRRDGAFEVPLDIRELFGEARPAVRMTIRKRTFKTRIMVYGGKYFLALWKAVLAEEKLRGGETLSVTIQGDAAPRTVKAPPALARAMKKSARARAGWTAMSYTHKKEWAQAIRDAKKPATRARRVALAIEALEARSAKK
jgi:hypothetical protein